jgi:carbamoyltransferase
MYILGISAYYHDSAAVLIKDGIVLCAIEEERFTRVKHDNGFPIHAVEWCLASSKIEIKNIDVISYYEKPLLRFERILDMFIQMWPHSLISFVKNMPKLLGEKLTIEDTIRKKLNYKGKIVFTPHHLSHAAAAYYSSPFTSSALLTIDGVGEYQTTALWKAKNGKIELINDIYFPHSLGLFYSTCAAYLGFKVNEDEYKLMGLAAYGKPKYIHKLKKAIDIKKDGSFNLDMSFFSFRAAPRMWSHKFELLLGKPRHPREKFTQRHADIAKSVQILTEQIYINILNHLHNITKEENISISGGVALNALANGLIHTQTPFKKSHIFGPAGDSGATLGTSLYTHHALYATRYSPTPIPSLSLGSHYSDSEIEIVLKKYNLTYKKLSEEKLIDSAAQALNKGKIIGWFQGRCEFGPRALGNRSILCKPSPFSMKTKVNIIKIREQFRPFAGSILQDYVHEYFDVPEEQYYAPFMNYCFIVKKVKRKELAAIVHFDNTCRIQTVSKYDGLYYQLINEFYKLSHIPCVLDTSFNLKGEPIVESPEQAVSDFIKTEIDTLFIGSFMVSKE